METRTVGPNLAVPLVQPGDGAVLIENLDINNTVLLSEDLGNAGVPGATTMLGPLASKTVDGSTAVWGITSGGQALVALTPGAITSTVSPAEIAVQLAQNGVPIVDNPTLLAVNFNITVPAGGTFATSEINVKQFQSIIGTLFATATSAGLGATPGVRVTFNWSISTDNFDPLRVDDWEIPSTPFNFVYNYRNDVRAPCDGNSLQIIFTNYDTKAVNVTYGVFGSYRPRSRPELRGRYQWNVSTGNPLPGSGLGSDSILLALSGGAVNAGASGPNFLMNMQNAPVTVSAIAIGGGPAGSWFLSIGPQIQGGQTQSYEVPNTATALLSPQTIFLPRHVCVVTLANNGAGAVNIAAYEVLISSQEQPA